MVNINRIKAIAAMVNVDGQLNNPEANNTEFGPLEWWSCAFIISGCVLSLAATLGFCRYKNLLTYWDQEGSTIVRRYLQKMSIYNLLILGTLYLTYVYVFNPNTADNSSEECLKIGEHKFIMFIITVGSLIAGLVRFLAVGFAHSESYISIGGKSSNPYPQNVHAGFSVDANHIYKKMINPYLAMSGVVLLVVIVFLYCPIPDRYTEDIMDVKFCLSAWSLDGANSIWRFIPLLMLLFIPVILIIAIEHFSHVATRGIFTETPGYISILNSPFIMVTLTTTWSMWMILLAVVWWTFGFGAGEYFSMLTLVYTAGDSLVLLFVTMVVGRKNQLC